MRGLLRQQRAPPSGTRPSSATRRSAGDERRAFGEDLVRRYTADEYIRALAAATGRSYGFIHQMLVEAGVQLRRRGGSRRRNAAQSSEG
ncbi:helix-turn-helix domain-containing protein [Catellatospora sp. NPDC049609]|uniref:helix-turn-helix domain-containing protein n=1 Tax=Catellatospora sp. NPDC049609 TaxID=3155505 RepID=UPI003420B81F